MLDLRTARSLTKWSLLSCLTLLPVAPQLATAQPGGIVVFGTSLSDPGNLFALTKQNNVPPAYDVDQLLVPDYDRSVDQDVHDSR